MGAPVVMRWAALWWAAAAASTRADPPTPKAVPELVTPARVMFLKLPRSGSSWVTSLLAGPMVTLSEEIITGKRARTNGDAECAAHLKLALYQPIGKVGAVGDVPQQMRAVKADPHPLCARPPAGGVLAPGGFRCLAAVGFTLNTNRKPNLDYVALAKSAPGVRVVLYLRTNRVKAAVSRVRGKLLDAVCGYNNIRTGAGRRAAKDQTALASADPRADVSSGRCRLNASLPVDVGDIKDALLINWRWEAATLAVVAKIEAAGVPVKRIAYEHFLGNRDASIAAVFDFLAVPGPLRPRRRADVYEKATSDDLAGLLPNYAAIEAWLAREVPCLLPHLRAKDPGAVFDQSCKNPWPDIRPDKWGNRRGRHRP